MRRDRPSFSHHRRWERGGQRREGVVLAVEFGTRNVAVATTIAVTVMGRPEFATFGVVYFLTEIPLMALVVSLARRHARAGGDDGSAP